MRSPNLLGLQTAEAILVLVALVAAACGTEPTAEKCTPAPAVHESSRQHADHIAIDVRFQSGCITLAGTLYQPPTDGPHPTMVFLHGSGEAPRLGFGGPWITTPLVDAGIAVMTYDKRGVGESQGDCCSIDDGFEALASDGLAAIDALLERDDVGPIGLLGVSQGGWVIAKMVDQSDDVDFTVIFSGTAVSVGEEIEYSRLTGGENFLPDHIDLEDVLEQVRQAGPSGFDPRPLLRTSRIPGLWIFGARDGSQPTRLDVEVLEQFNAEERTNFTIEVFPDLGHDTTHDPKAITTMLAWIERTLESTATFGREE